LMDLLVLASSLPLKSSWKIHCVSLYRICQYRFKERNVSPHLWLATALLSGLYITQAIAVDRGIPLTIPERKPPSYAGFWYCFESLKTSIQEIAPRVCHNGSTMVYRLEAPAPFREPLEDFVGGLEDSPFTASLEHRTYTHFKAFDIRLHCATHSQVTFPAHRDPLALQRYSLFMFRDFFGNKPDVQANMTPKNYTAIRRHNKTGTEMATLEWVHVASLLTIPLGVKIGRETKAAMEPAFDRFRQILDPRATPKA
jgi:hypothetical protein